MRAKKKAVSEMIAYVLLVVIIITLSVLVYAILKSYVWIPPVTCPSNAELRIEDYSCLPGKLLNVTISNSGYHNIDGFIIYLSNSSNKIAVYPVKRMIFPSNQVLANATVNESMSIGDIKEFVFNYSEYQDVKRVEIKPFIYEEQEMVLCGSLTEDTVCESGGGGEGGGVFCGDRACDNGETCSNCPSDCGPCCGNGACDNGESIYSCSQDCCAVELSPGVDNAIYQAIQNSPSSASEGYDQYVICINSGTYNEPLFGKNSDSFWSNKNGITLAGINGRAIIDLKDEDAINVRSQFITLRNLEIKNAHTQGAIAKNDNFRFINNIVHDVKRDGVQLNPSSGHTVINNTFYNVVHDAIACNGCKNAVISHNHIWKGICLPGVNHAGIYIYTTTSSKPSGIDLNCNLISEPNLDGGELPAGIMIDLTTELSIKVSRNFINNSIVYTSTGIKGPIILNQQSSFMFEDNYCNQTASSCVAESGSSYTCCNNPSENNYASWYSVCGNVGAY